MALDPGPSRHCNDLTTGSECTLCIKYSHYWLLMSWHMQACIYACVLGGNVRILPAKKFLHSVLLCPGRVSTRSNLPTYHLLLSFPNTPCKQCSKEMCTHNILDKEPYRHKQQLALTGLGFFLVGRRATQDKPVKHAPLLHTSLHGYIIRWT